MKSGSVNLLCPAVVAILILLSTMTAPVNGRMVTTNSEEMQAVSQGYKEVIEELAARVQQNNHIYQSGNEKTKMTITSRPKNTIDVFEEAVKMHKIATAESLECVGAGRYCNIVFGPRCCTNDFACVPPGLVGGVCVA
ncbi:hypothetical protein BVRB_9g218850 isoform A [Beta vulgaris subsp. vulgaris]|nr:hypothetical protein BVRB_9g218850 isoform A [Beta vulgaris subsp. vulgaris]